MADGQLLNGGVASNAWSICVFHTAKTAKAADVNGCYLELRRFGLILCSCN